MKIGKIIRALFFSIGVYVIELSACYVVAVLNQKSLSPYDFSVNCIQWLIGFVIFFSLLLPLEFAQQIKNSNNGNAK